MIRIRINAFTFVASDKDKIEAKFKFQGQSVISQQWLDLDFDWIEVNFSTREPDFYKELFQSHDDTQDNDTFTSFQVPIGNEKCVELFKFQIDAQILKYCQKPLNSCCFISLASAFVSINHNNNSNAISMCIEAYLKSEVVNRIDSTNDILKNNKRNEVEAKVYLNMIKYKKKGLNKILEDISENVTPVQLMDSLGNVNHAISVIGN